MNSMLDPENTFRELRENKPHVRMVCVKADSSSDLRKTKKGGIRKGETCEEKQQKRVLTGHSGWGSIFLKAALHSVGRPLGGAI